MDHEACEKVDKVITRVQGLDPLESFEPHLDRLPAVKEIDVVQGFQVIGHKAHRGNDHASKPVTEHRLQGLLHRGPDPSYGPHLALVGQQPREVCTRFSAQHIQDSRHRLLHLLDVGVPLEDEPLRNTVGHEQEPHSLLSGKPFSARKDSPPEGRMVIRVVVPVRDLPKGQPGAKAFHRLPQCEQRRTARGMAELGIQGKPDDLAGPSRPEPSDRLRGKGMAVTHADLDRHAVAPFEEGPFQTGGLLLREPQQRRRAAKNPVTPADPPGPEAGDQGREERADEPLPREMKHLYVEKELPQEPPHVTGRRRRPHVQQGDAGLSPDHSLDPYVA